MGSGSATRYPTVSRVACGLAPTQKNPINCKELLCVLDELDCFLPFLWNDLVVGFVYRQYVSLQTPRILLNKVISHRAIVTFNQ